MSLVQDVTTYPHQGTSEPPEQDHRERVCSDDISVLPSGTKYPEPYNIQT